MADYRYAYNGPEEGTAKAVLREAAISTKVAIELSTYLKGKNTEKAKNILQAVIDKKHAIPFKRFTDGVGHKKGAMAAGRYPLKGSQAFLRLIETAEANAASKGLSSELIIKHLLAHKASSPWHFGRQRRRQMKRTHVEIVLAEDEKAKKKKIAAKPVAKLAEEKPAAPKTEPKPAAKPETKPVEKPIAKPATKPVAPKTEAKPAAPKPVAKLAEEKPAAPKTEAKPAEKPADKPSPSTSPQPSQEEKAQ